MLPIFPYNSRIKTSWDIFLTFSILASSLLIPYRIIFKSEQLDALYWAFTLIFSFDILFNFNSGLRKGVQIIEDRKTLVRSYLNGWFTIDILSAFPFLLIISPAVNNTSHNWILSGILTIIQLFRLLKLLKMNGILRQLQENLRINPGAMRLISFAFWFSLGVHIFALGWIAIGASEQARPPMDQYIRALYWCLTTVATIGYGDYYPNHESNIQIIYTMIIQIIGVGMYGYIIGNVSSLIANLDVAKAAYLKRMEEIQAYLNAKKIPSVLQSRVRDYYRYLWETRHSTSAVDVVENLPQTLSLEISLYLNREILHKVSFFKNVGELFIREITHCLHPMIFLPDDYVIRQGEHGDCMYFVSSGELEVLINNNKIAQLGAGSPFGETALIQNEKRSASIRAITYCDAYRLSREDFDGLRAKYPEFDAEIKKVIEERKKPSSNNK
jgi:hypothetical protein